MITKEQAKIGTKVKSNVDFSGVPKGTIGIIDDHYGTDGEILGVMVAWDLRCCERESLRSLAVG